MSNQTLLIIAIALLGGIFAMLGLCAYLLQRGLETARKGTATLYVNNPSSLGLRGGGGGGGGKASSPSAKLRMARARVHDAETSLRAAKGRLTEVENETSAPAKAPEHTLNLGDLTPEERADMSRKVSLIYATKAADLRAEIATAVPNTPFEPDHAEALVKLHNALGVAKREFDASIKAAPSNADTFGLQS